MQLLALIHQVNPALIVPLVHADNYLRVCVCVSVCVCVWRGGGGGGRAAGLNAVGLFALGKGPYVQLCCNTPHLERLFISM